MFGYMSAKEAKEKGFTHHASYYGIPIWFGDNEESPLVSAKWSPLEYLFTPIHYIEGLIQTITQPDYDGYFCFKLGDEL